MQIESVGHVVMPQVTTMLSVTLNKYSQPAFLPGKSHGQRSQSTLGAVWLGKQVAAVVMLALCSDRPPPHFF